MAQADFFRRYDYRDVPPPPERSLHIAIADLLRINTKRTGWWWSHIPSGEYRREETGALLKRMGLRPGMADFLLIAPTAQHFWMEVKAGLEDLNEDQEQFAKMCRARGVPFVVVRRFEKAKAQLQTWGAIL